MGYKRYYPCAIQNMGFDGEKVRPALWSPYDSCLTLDKALASIEAMRKRFTIYCSWVEEYDNDVEGKKAICFANYTDGIGFVEKPKEEQEEIKMCNNETKRTATAERFGDIVTVKYYGGGDCLWLYMYLDCSTWTMCVTSDIGDYSYCWNNRGVTNGQTFDKFCVEWFGNSEWLLRKCVGENRHSERTFDFDATRRNLVEAEEDWDGCDDDYKHDLLEAINDAEDDDTNVFTARLQTIADERRIELPDEWWACIVTRYTPWQNRFAKICDEYIAPAIKEMLEKEENENGKND